ncbi:MAG: 50S ribosomal protein L18 [Nanoarchaeota archaeon]
MKKTKVFSVQFRRKREGKTFYKKRMKLLLSGSYRFVVRKSSKNIQTSIIEYRDKGDHVLFTVNSKTLHKLGWKGNTGNLPSAYFTGILAGKKAIEKGIKEVILDLGFNKSIKGSSIYAALAGAIDAGLKIPSNPKVLPTRDRISGAHIAKYAELLKNDKSKYNKQFSAYIKRGIYPDDIVKHFDEVKGKING